MVATVAAATGLVLTVKVALLLPAGTVTLEGTLAAALPLESITCAPAAGAGPLSVTVPVGDCVAPVTMRMGEEVQKAPRAIWFGRCRAVRERYIVLHKLPPRCCTGR